MSIITSLVAMAVSFYLLFRNTAIVVAAIRKRLHKSKGFKLALFLVCISGLFIGLQLAWMTYKESMPEYFNFFWDILDIILLLYVMFSSEDEIRKTERDLKK